MIQFSCLNQADASHVSVDVNLDVDLDVDVVASDVDAKVCILPPCLGILTPFHT